MALLDTPLAAPERELSLARYALADALRLERELGIGHVLSQILVRRGLADPEAARAFLAADERHDPTGFAGIDRAVLALRGAIADGRRITVHGDYDVDGVCATAIMVRALRSLGAVVDWFIPGRLEDGYGLSSATVRRLAARGTELILTVDCAITAVEEVALARAEGLEVVVSDHHAPRADGRLPDCPIVHPAVCGYPCPDLCGTGVAHKLALALGAPSAEAEAELVALATVADLVPLTGENRRLVREGLRALGVTTRPGLRALMAVAKVDPGALDAGALGFRLAPRINAAGRLTRADAGLELLLCEDPARAAQIAAELDAVNAERRTVEQRILWEAEAQIRERTEREDGPPPSAYVLAGEGWHPGVVGIVASRIVEAHHRPAVLIALDPASGTGTGSARSIPGFDLLAGLHAAAPHLGRYGGHRAAAGLSLELGALEDFRISFEAHASEMLTAEMLVPVERADAVVSGAELGLALIEELEALEPCGIGSPAPRLLVPGGRFCDVRPMGEGRHARFNVVSGGVRAKAVAFGCDGRIASDPAAPHDATFRLERNAWNGAVEPRLVLRHARRCAPAPIGRLGEELPYLAAVLAELDAELPGRAPSAPAGPGVGAEGAPAGPAIVPEGDPAASIGSRTLLDRRGESPLAVLTDALSCGGAVLAVCADVPRRIEGLGARAGGFTLAGYEELVPCPGLVGGFDQLVALDPPAGAAARALLAAGAGATHLAWGPAEVRFAQQVHEREYGLRPSLIALYRALRERERAAGEELEHLLRGDDPRGRSAALAGRLVRVLVELELVSLDRDLPSLAIARPVPTALERSASFRFYAERYEDGRRFLSSANHPPTG
ncbi:MAG TPA: single-stranded-DNA-specific exonuclease RecJ [Solirubrobacteraceae bacterium]|nr:single-stranded-DNA-specific exonuclease RecJ [Solirubrobacteraceae bacterium]